MSKKQRKRRTRGLGYPSQACGLSYKEFRGGWTYADAYEMVAYGRGDEPRTITQNVVRRMLAKLKRDEFARYQKDCKLGAREQVSLGATRTHRVSPNQTSFTFMQKEPFSRRRPKKSDLKQCTIAGHIRTCESDDGGAQLEYVTTDRTSIATLYLDSVRTWNRDTGRNEELTVVSGIEVDTKHLGSGVGTKLYEAGLRWARRAGTRLASDKTRSVFSEAFWRKQESKGRAECFNPDARGNYYAYPLQKVHSACERGALSQALCDKLLTRNWPKPVSTNYDAYGSWPCQRWAMRSKDITSLGKVA